MTGQKCLCGATAPHAQPGMGASSVCPLRLVRCERPPKASSGTTTRSDLKRRTACGNRPPQVAFPSLPTLPPLPERVDPDRLPGCHPWTGIFPASVGADGVVDVDDEHYYIQQALAGQRVVLLVNAPDRSFEVWLEGRMVKSLPRKRPLWPGDDLAEVGGIHEGASPL